MGEMVRRMEYERRAKNLMKQPSRDKLIGKEYTAPVRAANTFVRRSLDSAMDKVDSEQKSFRDKHSKTLGNVHALRRTISSKSLNFTDDKFGSENRLVFPPISTGNQDGAVPRRLKRRKSSISMTALVERHRQTEPEEGSTVSDNSELHLDLSRRNSLVSSRRLSMSGATDGRSFRALKDTFSPKESEMDSRSRLIHDCKIAEERRGSVLSERIQELYLKVQQT